MNLRPFTLLLPAILMLFGLSAQAQEQELTSFDVIDLGFFVKDPKVKPGYRNQIEVGTIEMKADMEKNRIQRFNVSVSTRYGSVYQYSATLSELRGKTIPLKVSSVKLGSLQGVSLNADGEGVLRFSPASSLLGPGMPKSIELTLKRVGAYKNWVVLYQSQVLRKAKMEISKNPYEMSSIALLMSAPKIISMDTEYLDCGHTSVASMLVKYQAAELLKLTKCDFRNHDANSAHELISTIAFNLDVYSKYYGEGISPTDTQNQMLWSLQVLQSMGLKITPETILAEPYGNSEKSDLFETLVENGHEEVIKDFLARGLYPTLGSVLESAVINTFQTNPKTLAVTESGLGRRILELIRPTIKEKGIASDTLLSIIGYEGSKTLTLASLEHEKADLLPVQFEYLKRTVALMITEGFDLATPDDNFKKSAQDWIRRTMDPNDQFLTKQHAKIISEQLTATSAK